MSRKLFNLARDNRAQGAGIRSEATAEDTTTIYIYDIIDSWWGVSAADFARELAAVTTANVVLRINSPGGDVFEARAMMTAIAAHPATFTAKVDGLAASAATALTLACDTVEMAEGTFYMIHQAWTFAMGNADDMRASAELLEKVDATLVAGYTKRSGKTNDEIVAWMKAETWFTAEEAVTNGFADSVSAIGSKAKAQAKAFNLAAYANAPQALTESPAEEDVRDSMLARCRLYERTA
ncbi:Clp protease ClpP [soil metagenome]